jgi:peptidoglycan/xylan/chitin deacetylase (PgdA/CDA1 family)
MDLSGIRDKTKALLSALRTHRVPALGLVTGQAVEVRGEIREREALLGEWRKAGAELGNHGYAHLDLNRAPLESYQADVMKCDAVLRRILGTDGPAPRYFRHPLTHTGAEAGIKSSFDRFLGRQGYQAIPFTIENADYIFASLYAKAQSGGDQSLALRLKQAYLEHTDKALAFIEGCSEELFHRPIPQILLIHANTLNADLMDEILSRLESRGYRFIALEDALRDATYATEDSYVGAKGPSWLHRWSLSLTGRWRLEEEPDPPKWVLDLFQAR